MIIDLNIFGFKGQHRIWPPAEGVQEPEVPVVSTHNAEATFRHPLPPGIVRPRLPIAPGGVIRQQQAPRMPGDIRLQGLDPRMRMLIQQQQQQVTKTKHRLQSIAIKNIKLAVTN